MDAAVEIMVAWSEFDQSTGHANKGVLEEARMKPLSPDLEYQALQPAMQQKILTRAAEVIALGWTRRTAARDAHGQKVRSTAPQATAWCVVGAVDRALYELLNVDVYEVLGVDADMYDTTPCRLPVVRALRWPICYLIGRADVATWNDAICPDAPAAERLLRAAAEQVPGVDR